VSSSVAVIASGPGAALIAVSRSARGVNDHATATLPAVTRYSVSSAPPNIPKTNSAMSGGSQATLTVMSVFPPAPSVLFIR